MYSEKAQKALLPERLLGFLGFVVVGVAILSCEHGYFGVIHVYGSIWARKHEYFEIIHV